MTGRFAMRGRCAAWLLLSALAGGLRAADAPGAVAPGAVASRGESCTHIADGASRLACYDAAFGVGAVAAPAAAGHVRTPSPSQAAAVMPAREFGDRGQLHGQAESKAALPRRVNFKVKKAESLAGGLFRLTMDNGQVWVTKEADWALEFKDGEEVTIQRMILDNYQVSHAGHGRNVTVARVF
jgi:hypothetical protein